MIKQIDFKSNKRSSASRSDVKGIRNNIERSLERKEERKRKDEQNIARADACM